MAMAAWEHPELIKNLTEKDMERLAITQSGQTFTFTKGKEKPELAFCIIHQEIVSMEWAFMFRFIQLPNHFYIAERNAPYDAARNSLVKKARESGAKYVFFMDSDVKPCRPDAVMRLVEIAKKEEIDVLTGVYYAKHPEGEPSAYMIAGVKDRMPSFAPVSFTDESIKNNDLVRIEAAGAGCMLINTDVFRRWDEKWPNRSYFKWGGGLSRYELEMLDIYETSEDFNWCIRLKELGVKMYAAPSIQFDHIAWVKKKGDKKGEFGFLEY
jgi:glycosyltransferase involved in cell wall biosynthesis